MCKGRYATDNYHHNGSVDPQDPLFPKGGQWPKFGVPTMTRTRPKKKGRGAIIIEHLSTLFDVQFAEERVNKVIPLKLLRQQKSQ